ncbi:serpin-like SPI-3 [Cotia virus SPAn232]|uniref:Serpin-like SPI-3 n=2 Tax=Cotia virus TaxID=39444 RepID=H6TAI5_9POXV|nr:serpin-like SPI-3 [Cotia virus SPAn232]AFB76922.1 serpin-like SPI-3 [Cotia virus SPAn232]AIT70647.1 serpin-like SPI-3 [Cotia virus]
MVKYIIIFSLLYSSTYCINDKYTNFGLKLFKNIINDAVNKNVIFSPFGVSMATSMLQLLTSENTRNELVTSMNYDIDHDNDKNIINSKYIFNDIFVDKSIYINNDISKKFFNKFKSTLKIVDFIKPNDIVLINKYIEDKTNKNIMNIIDTDSINHLTKMMLLNTMYFKSEWKDKFNPNNTFRGIFHKENGQDVTVQMMRKNFNNINVGKFKVPSIEKFEYTVIELPYKDKNISMYMVIPNDKKCSIYTISKYLSVNLINFWNKHMKKDFYNIIIPKFKYEYEINFKNLFNKVGIYDIFDSDKANFKPMTDDKIFINKALQRTKIIIDETGTEASAVTYIDAILKSVYEMIIFDRPFLFLIINKSNNAVYFSGIVNEPN